MELPSQSVHAVCEAVQVPHGKIETLCHEDPSNRCALSYDNMPPDMTPLEWSQAQTKDPALCQIIKAIQHKTIQKLEMKNDMPSDLKGIP